MEATESASSAPETRPGLPGTVGTPAFSMAALHSILSPHRFIDFDVGPTKFTPFLSHRSAKSPFSDKNP